MRTSFFLCFAFLLCSLAVTSSASEISHTLEKRGVHVSKHLSSAPDINSESAVANIQDVEKNQRGKGSNGGGSIARQPRTIDRNSALTLNRPSISMSTTDFMSSLFLFLVLPFVIP